MVPDNKIHQHIINARWSTDYVKAFAGRHKPTTVRVALAIHALGGGILPRDEIAAEAGVSRRTFNDAVTILKSDSLLEVIHRHNGSGKPVPSHFALQPISGHKARSGDGQVSARRARTCASATEDYKDLDQKIEELPGPEEDLEDLGIGLDLPSVGVPRSGGSPDRPEVDPTVEPGIETKVVQTVDTLGRKIVPFAECRLPLVDPALEQLAVEILELLDKLRVRDGHRPMAPGSRPSQLASARLLVAHDGVSGVQTLDMLRWAFSGQSGAKKWARRIDKPFTLRQHHHALQEAYRKAMVADISGGDPEPEPYRAPERTPEEWSLLGRRLNAFCDNKDWRSVT